ncbi:TetR/AcrR family transcriptional regulator [Lactobacillus sp. ESL0791]|uniref:TetR/AcrR family transcriptional regulator n=1 Tax=Lactobacillus sp. ESL0791 TaxID=2983234 RepID=UPI0023F8A54E|nr:TetR/AcrR family transcriptional regulator [Lactobacillus sp. ESL0791]MDF7638020.1 TetR/AcrR family transcriptional regulator [Lactobacillus sp. ESL0791]
MVNIHTSEQKNAKRQQIMQAAITLFAKQSYADITMQQIATAAGSSKGTLFNYFATKEDLFMCILLEDYQVYLGKISSWVSEQKLISKDDFVQLMVEQTKNLIKSHSVLVRLNAIRGPVLEGKANMHETLLRRNQLYQVSKDLGQHLTEKTGNLLSQGQFSHLFIIQSGIISGLMNMSSLSSFNHQKINTIYPDFEIDLIPEAQRQMRYYLTEFLKEHENNGTSKNS